MRISHKVFYGLIFFFGVSAASAQTRKIITSPRQALAIPELQKDSCDRWHAWVGVGGQQPISVYQQQYDTLRRFIESCAKNDPSPHDAFNGLNNAVGGYAPNDTTRYDRFRAWLISVLYLNTTDPYYFCACLESIE